MWIFRILIYCASKKFRYTSHVFKYLIFKHFRTIFIIFIIFIIIIHNSNDTSERIVSLGDVDSWSYRCTHPYGSNNVIFAMVFEPRPQSSSRNTSAIETKRMEAGRAR